jgi:hypothetical protein
MIEWFILKFGLILNIIGTLMIAFSIGRNREDVNQTYKAKSYYLAAILRPKMFIWGIILLVLGFLLSILDSFILNLVISSP